MGVPVLAASTGTPLGVLTIGDSLPHRTLVDQLGRTFALDEPANVPTIVSFIYTRCRDPRMCPLVSAKFRQLQDAGTPLRLIEITLDPGYDRPAVLREYGRLYGADPSRWRLATGDPAAVDELASAFGIASRVALPGTVVHTDVAALFDANGRLVSLVDGSEWAANEMLALAIASGNPGALARVRDAIRSTWNAICGSPATAGAPSRTARAAVFVGSLVPASFVVAWGIALGRRERRRRL